ncbi:alpha/beta hydrolase [Luteolibacter yonseiensis]|uniref:Alpha/beta hydrolase n=1 Tax=Luteolibacter yonseiensis TaxID=1144680 RepID=A0A934VDN6_9BACT|nr:alpha/beta hydrolase [Luteolibacter yonseiensis]MBK1818226.1 alpha/beta hydrolase [Luteolibacter yonseiensis]
MPFFKDHNLITPGLFKIFTAVIPVLFLCNCILPVAAPLPKGVRLQRDVTYTPPSWPSPLTADIFHRPGSPPAPAVLLVHGGSWKAGGARWPMNGIARKLAARGYVVVNVSYRGAPSDHYSAPVHDLREAIRWMRRHADEYGIDPRHIATYGFSAGGHLAAQVALRDHNPENVEAIVAASAPFDLTIDPNMAAVPEFLGTTEVKNLQLFREASPVNHVNRSSPPIFIYQGTSDDLVKPEHAIRMRAAYRRAGMDPQIHWMPGRSHVDGFLLPGKKVDQAIDFLDGIMKQ